MKVFRAWYPEAYQGTHRKKGYFEGWYLKLIDSPGKTIFALIPGVSTGRSRNDAHAFIQLINAVTGKTEYFRFALEAFSADDRKFDVRIGSNHFWDGGMQVNLQNETTSLSGSLRFEQIEKYPTSLLHPGIMGPFSFIPWMECYHGVVNISHTIVGSLMYNGGALDMTGGEGYIEKDWGKSFPKSWIWMQANHFSTPKASFMFSLCAHSVAWNDLYRIDLLSANRSGIFPFRDLQRRKGARAGHRREPNQSHAEKPDAYTRVHGDIYKRRYSQSAQERHDAARY